LSTFPAETGSPDETVALGARIARTIAPGDVVALYGDLGTGKTHLVKGIAAGMGFDAADVDSPTFVLVHEYATDPPLYHFDAYRIVRPSEFVDIGFHEYAGGDGICVIERFAFDPEPMASSMSCGAWPSERGTCRSASRSGF
jgi:tRNA threonylcarbamoyladenosine biosynthesis protein TsaE